MVKKQYYLAVTNLPALLQRTLSNHKKDLDCLNCIKSSASNNKLKEICNNYDSYRIGMSKQVEKILKYNPGEK